MKIADSTFDPLQRMLRSRIARRVLAEQHIALTTQYHDTLELGPLQDSHRVIGIIDTSLSPMESILALEDILPRVTGVQTKIVVDGEDAAKIRFAFINDHIQFIAFELIKNAVLAAVKTGRPDAAQKIFVTLTETANSIGVRISDECKSLRMLCLYSGVSDKLPLQFSWRYFTRISASSLFQR